MFAILYKTIQKTIFRGFNSLLSYNKIKKERYFMEYKKFKEILKNNDLTIKKFSELAGISYSTCNTWSNRGTVSAWVESWLKLYSQNISFKNNNPLNEEYQELLQLKESLQTVMSGIKK